VSGSRGGREPEERELIAAEVRRDRNPSTSILQTQLWA